MTKKKTRFRLKPIDLFVVISCLSICAIFITLFWKDLNSSSTRTDINEIATISFKHKVAQRKYSDRVVWERLQETSPLYNNDTIRTADLADATIKFVDGTILELHENTMLQIAYSENGVKLSVGGGNVEVDSSASEKSVQIQMENGSSINLNAGSKISAKSDSETGEASFQIQSGSGSVKSEDGTNQVISTGESVKVSSVGQVRKGGITVTSIASDVRVLNFEEKPVPVHLEWKTSDDYSESEIIIETSRSKDFKVIEDTYTAKGASQLDLPADDGVLYWRIFAKEEQEEPVEGKVKVENVDSVDVLSPANGAVYKYRAENPQIGFRWNGNEYADHYKLEISRNSNFTNVLFNEDVGVQALNLDRFDEGTYYWRVTPFYALNNLGYGETSTIRSFTIEKREKLNPPMLTVPAQNAKFLYTGESYSSLFMWKSEVKAYDYNLVIAKDEEFENPVYSFNTENPRIQPEFNITKMPEGEYYWKIIRNCNEEDDNKISEVRKFSVEKYVPAKNRLIYPPEKFGIEEQKIANLQFVWKLGDDYKNKETESVMQICKNAQFDSEVMEYKTNQTEIKNLSLKNGSYYWRVGVFDEISNDFNFTEARAITVLTELGVPLITYPAIDSVLIAGNSKPVNFKWGSVPDADYYKVRLYDSDGNIIQEANDIRSNSVDFVIDSLVTDKNTVNNARISVQAFAEESEFSGVRVGKHSSVDFKVRSPSHVILGAPENNKKIAGLDALRNPVPLTWLSGEDKVEYAQLILRKTLENGNTKIVQIIENPDKTVYFQQLTEGNYQWTVKANTADGFILDAQEYKNFTIEKIPELQSAAIVEPSLNFVIGPAYLRKHRTINFEWSKVPDATDYVFVLYKKTSEGLKKIYNQSGKDNVVKFKELKLLDVGEFEWQVTAYSYSKEGYEEQHSSVSVGNFKIEFAKPKKVQTKDPGRLYAD